MGNLEPAGFWFGKELCDVVQNHRRRKRKREKTDLKTELDEFLKNKSCVLNQNDLAKLTQRVRSSDRNMVCFCLVQKVPTPNQLSEIINSKSMPNKVMELLK